MNDRTQGIDIWWRHPDVFNEDGERVACYEVEEIPITVPSAIMILEIVARRMFELEQHQGNFSLTPTESDLLRVIDWLKDPVNMEAIYKEIQSPLDPDGNPWSIYPVQKGFKKQPLLDNLKVDLSKVIEEITGIDMVGLEEVQLKVIPDKDDEVDFW